MRSMMIILVLAACDAVPCPPKPCAYGGPQCDDSEICDGVVCRVPCEDSCPLGAQCVGGSGGNYCAVDGEPVNFCPAEEGPLE